MQKILVLGAGMVAKPLVEYLLRAGYRLSIASNTPKNAESIIAGNALGSFTFWEAKDHIQLNELLAEHDLAISLLPYKFHLQVAKACIYHKKHLITTSYVSDEMEGLDLAAREAGVLLLNEVGLDPGIDHISAMRVIDGIHDKGGKVAGFYSITGALPAPESANNPFRYKFSWSPRGVILASKNGAEYLKDGKRIKIASENLFKDYFEYNIPELGILEAYPNRDSISYMDLYGIPEASTIFRGTFRYKGWCETLDLMRELRLLREKIHDYSGFSYSDFTKSRLPKGKGEVKDRVADFLKINVNSHPIKAIEWLGLFSNDDMGYNNISPFEIIYKLMLKKMMLSENDRDVIVMKHLFKAEYPDGSKEVITSKLIAYGALDTNTAIAQTVGIPAAIAADFVLQKKIKLTGVHIPVLKSIYQPILNRLEEVGYSVVERFGLPESEFIG